MHADAPDRVVRWATFAALAVCRPCCATVSAYTWSLHCDMICFRFQQRFLLWHLGNCLS